MMERWRFAICRTLEQAAALERHRTCSACTRPGAAASVLPPIRADGGGTHRSDGRN
jgi:hypothetical protein